MENEEYLEHAFYFSPCCNKFCRHEKNKFASFPLWKAETELREQREWLEKSIGAVMTCACWCSIFPEEMFHIPWVVNQFKGLSILSSSSLAAQKAAGLRIGGSI